MGSRNFSGFGRSTPLSIPSPAGLYLQLRTPVPPLHDLPRPCSMQCPIKSHHSCSRREHSLHSAEAADAFISALSHRIQARSMTSYRQLAWAGSILPLFLFHIMMRKVMIMHTSASSVCAPSAVWQLPSRVRPGLQMSVPPSHPERRACHYECRMRPKSGHTQ